MIDVTNWGAANGVEIILSFSDCFGIASKLVQHICKCL